jgi:regulator of RNase E activity RraB
MSDEWNSYLCRVDDEPASFFLDLGIRQSAPVPGFSEAAYLRVWMNNPRPDGLSSQEEFEALVAIEHALEAEVERDGVTIYVGRNTSSGRRDFFFYTKDGEAFRASASAAMSKFGEYKAEIGLRPDEKWDVYFNFLYPNDNQKQVMGNRDVVEALRREGDDGQKTRLIDHLILLGGRQQADAVAQTVAGLGFRLKPGMPSERPTGEWRVEFDKVDAPVAIDETTITLSELARKYGGKYDGWGCEVSR